MRLTLPVSLPTWMLLFSDRYSSLCSSTSCLCCPAGASLRLLFLWSSISLAVHRLQLRPCPAFLSNTHQLQIHTFSVIKLSFKLLSYIYWFIVLVPTFLSWACQSEDNFQELVLPLPFGSWGSNSENQACQQGPLLAGPSHRLGKTRCDCWALKQLPLAFSPCLSHAESKET